MIVVCCILLSTTTYAANNPEDPLIVLSNENIEIGILPEVAGRIVMLRKPGMKNILRSDEEMWPEAAEKKPEINAFANFTAFNGNITWIGPQKEWWIHQDLNEERKSTKADWPPDPYTIYSKYEITEQLKSYIRLAGPVSPINGLSLIKEYSITEEGKVKIKITATNERETAVSWDLWMLTRLDGFSKAYVPVEQDEIFKLIIKENKKVETTPYKIENNYFTFL